jgi:hypothetical protein
MLDLEYSSVLCTIICSLDSPRDKAPFLGLSFVATESLTILQFVNFTSELPHLYKKPTPPVDDETFIVFSVINTFRTELSKAVVITDRSQFTPISLITEY